MRKNEIEKRLAEIKGILAGTGECDVNALETEIRSLKAEMAELDLKEKRQQIADGLQDGTITGRRLDKPTDEKRDAEDPYATLEYRKEFMNFCKTGVLPEKRLDAFTSTTEAAAVIPTTIMSEIIKEMKSYGQLFNRARKLNVKGGVKYPILSLKPVATRISESTVSDRKQMNASTSVSFTYLGLECKVATSLLAETVSLPEFEAQIVPLIAEAMIKVLEIEMLNGNGTTEMLGITQDPRVLAAQQITLAAADFSTWNGWKTKVFAKIPLAYRAGGSFVMAAGTFDGQIDGMVDANGQPVGRTNYGITDGPQERFGGREVILVEDDVIKPYDTAAVGDVVAVYLQINEYAINSNMQMSMYRWLDHDTNQWVDKAILINDGKLLDAHGVIIVKKGA